MPPIRILVVDDEEVIADTLSEILRKKGYEAFAAYNGQLGLEAARSFAPNLVLSDVMMPELDGVSMAMEISKTLPGVKVLLFSGMANMVELLDEARQQGFHFEILRKPVAPDEIIRKIVSTLATV